MSYRRFSEGDVSMYPSEEGIECCLCLLSPPVRSVFTEGGDHPLFGHIEPCVRGGNGCEKCMVHDSLTFHRGREPLPHLLEPKRSWQHRPATCYSQVAGEAQDVRLKLARV
jgi:hypothetical protein